MSYNREKCDFLFPNEKSLMANASVSAEGMLLVGALEDGIEKVKPCAGTSSEIAVGFSSSTRLLLDKEIVSKEITVPAAGPYTITLGHTNLVAGQVRIAGLTLDPVVAAGKYSLNATTGILTFDAAQAGQAFTVTYKRNLSVAEARELHREGFLHNARAFEVYEKVGVIQGKGIMYTDQFDVAADFSAGGVLKTMAGGLITVGGSGAALPSHVRVIAVPGLDNPYLGLEFSF